MFVFIICVCVCIYTCVCVCAVVVSMTQGRGMTGNAGSKSVEFHLRCEERVAARREFDAMRRARQLEREQHIKELAELKKKEEERRIEEELDRNMFKAKPYRKPKHWSPAAARRT